MEVQRRFMSSKMIFDKLLYKIFSKIIGESTASIHDLQESDEQILAERYFLEHYLKSQNELSKIKEMIFEIPLANIELWFELRKKEILLDLKELYDKECISQAMFQKEYNQLAEIKSFLEYSFYIQGLQERLFGNKKLNRATSKEIKQHYDQRKAEEEFTTFLLLFILIGVIVGMALFHYFR